MILGNSQLGAADDEPLFWFPSDVKNLANVVDAEFEQVKRKAGGSEDFSDLYSRWKTFFGTVMGTWFMLGGSDAQAIQDYRKKLQWYWDNFGVSGPRPSDQKDPEAPDVANKLMLMGGIGLGVYILAQTGLLRKLGGR